MAARSYWVAPVPPLNFADGTPFVGVSLLDVSPSPVKVIGAGVPEQGTGLRLRAAGLVSATTTGPTLTLGFYWGGIAGASLAGVAGGNSPASGAASWPWIMEYEGEFRAIGAAGQIVGMGKLYWPTSLTAWTVQPIPATLAARTVAVSTAAQQAVTVGANWSSATGAPSLTVNRLSVELVG